MSRLWFKRGIAHQLGSAKLGGPPYKIGAPTSFWNRKLPDNQPIINDGNNYAAKLAWQARATSNNGLGYFPNPYQFSINTSTYSVPLWVMPAGYPTRKVRFAQTTTGFCNTTQGSATITNVTGTWTNGQAIFNSYGALTENSTIVSGAGTSTMVLSAPATQTATGVALYTPFPDSWVSNLQGLCNNIPVPRIADLPAGHDGRLMSLGTDEEIAIWQPSTDTMWEFWHFRGTEPGGFSANWGGVIQNVSQNDGTLPHTWGAKACSLMAFGGCITMQELRDERIDHAINLAVVVSENRHLAPATRHDSSSLVPGGSFANAVPEGAIFRFPPNIFIDPTWSKFLQLLVKAVRDYGLVICDTAGTVQFQGEGTQSVGTQFSNAPDYAPPIGFGNGRNDLVTFPWEQLVQVAYP